MPERQKIECPKGAQLYVAVSILSASIGIPADPQASYDEHSAEFRLFEAVYPWPSACPFSKGRRILR